MTFGLSELVSYWLGDLDEERSDAVEEALFRDPEVARRLDAIAKLEAGLQRMITEGRLSSAVTRAGLESFQRAGLELREYHIHPGQVVPCTSGTEDFSVISLAVPEGIHEVDLVAHFELEGQPPSQLERPAVPALAGEVVLVFPGDQIRALPRARVHYEARAAGVLIGQYHLDHTPSR